MPRLHHALTAVAVLAVSACSANNLYSGGQAWQRNHCERILDANERARCMASAATSFEEYQRQRREADARR